MVTFVNTVLGLHHQHRIGDAASMIATPNRIREFRDARGMSMAKLAAAAGTTPQQIQRLETGERRLTVDWMVKLGKALDVDPASLMAAEPGAQSAVPGLPPSLGAWPMSAGPRDLPVLGRGEGGNGDPIIPVETPPIDYTFRPPQLVGVPGAFAIYVTGNSMFPLYRPGNTLWIHPSLPLTNGRGVLLIRNDNHSLVKEYVKATEKEFCVQEYYPERREFRVPKSEIRSAFRILGMLDTN